MGAPVQQIKYGFLCKLYVTKQVTGDIVWGLELLAYSYLQCPLMWITVFKAFGVGG
jgi:hypothetical protein